MDDWKRVKTGWVSERNFEVDVATDDAGKYRFRLRVIGFPAIEKADASYPTADEAVTAAISVLEKEFGGPVDLE